jgi:hypothetical protein
VKKVAVPRLTAYIFYLLLPGRDPLFFPLGKPRS